MPYADVSLSQSTALRNHSTAAGTMRTQGLRPAREFCETPMRPRNKAGIDHCLNQQPACHMRGSRGSLAPGQHKLSTAVFGPGEMQLRVDAVGKCCR